MATRAQIARRKYKCALSELNPGQKAQVTIAFNQQDNAPAQPRARTPSTSNLALVKFGRPGVNGLKEALIKNTATMGEALEQAGVVINKSKEGILHKVTGDVIMYDDTVEDGAIYVITPGVDSSNC